MLAALKGPGEIVAEMLMTRQVHKGSFLLVEGDDDSRFFRSRVAAAECEIIIGGGKPNVCGAIARLDGRRFRGAVAAVDDDYDSLNGQAAPSPNLVATDAHSLECLLRRSRALDKVLAEHGDAGRIRAFELQGQTVRDALVQRGLAFGQLRWLAARHGWALDFRPLTPQRFIDRKTWTVDQAGLLAEAVHRGCPLRAADLQAALDALPLVDPWRVCHGHDLVDILVIGLKGVLGCAQTLGRNQTAALLRQGMEKTDFAATGFYGDLHAWERANPPYAVLAV